MTHNDQDKDLVTQVFERMRQVSKDSGHKIPSLQRPPRRKAGWQGFDSTAVARVAPEESATAEADPKESQSPQVRDRAGTVVPEHILRDRGIRINRRYDRRPQAIGSILSNQILERGWQLHIARGVIMTEWDSLVGETVAEHTSVREFNEGTLVVDCASTAWATQLRYLQSMILKAIARRVGDGVVTELKIYGPKPPKMYQGRLRVKGRGPRDTYG